MNDRYLFRAKRKNWKELPKEEQWVQGYLFDNGFSGNTRYFVGGLIIQECKSGICEGWHVAGTDFCEIDPSTLCQCTGLKDKNGTLIWENDVVKTSGVLYVCYWDECNAEYSLKNKDESFGLGYSAPYLLEVVGNIFDNSDLL